MKLSLVDMDGLATIQRPPMLVDKILPQGSICILAGPTFSGKTFFAMELAKSISTLDPFMHHYKVPTRGNVLFIEQDAPQHDTGRAMYAMLREKREESRENREKAGFGPVDLHGDGIFFSFHPGIDLRRASDMSSIAETANSIESESFESAPQMNLEIDEDGCITELRPEFSTVIGGCSLIVLDTLRSLHGADENDSTQMEQVMQNIKQLRAATGATIVLVHHKRKEQAGFFNNTGSRGSTAIDAAADNVFEFKSNKKTNTSICTVTKARVISAPNIEFSINSSFSEEGHDLKEVRFVREVGEVSDFSEVDAFIRSNTSTELCYTFIIQNKKGVTTEDLAKWTEENKMTIQNGVRIANKLVTDQRIDKISFVENGKHRIRYIVKTS